MKELEVNGQRVSVNEYGAPSASASPLLLIHGAGHDHGVWDEIATGLAAAGEHVFAPDLPAHGGSAGTPLATVDAMADWVLALASALDLQAFRLGGHSMGSLVALATAAAAPQRVQGLYLVGASAPMPVSPFLLEAARSEPERAWALINKFSFAPAEVLGEARRLALAAANLARMQQQGGQVLGADLAACNDWQAGLSAAGRIRCPTLLVCGELDRMTPAEGAKPLLAALQAGACRAHMIVLARCGHAMMQEAPDALIQALRGQA